MHITLQFTMPVSLLPPPIHLFSNVPLIQLTSPQLEFWQGVNWNVGCTCTKWALWWLLCFLGLFFFVLPQVGRKNPKPRPLKWFRRALFNLFLKQIAVTFAFQSWLFNGVLVQCHWSFPFRSWLGPKCQATKTNCKGWRRPEEIGGERSVT